MPYSHRGCDGLGKRETPRGESCPESCEETWQDWLEATDYLDENDAKFREGDRPCPPTECNAGKNTE